MMRDIIYSLPDQISQTVGSMSRMSFGRKKYTGVLVCGMGGSGISGEVAAVLYPGVRVTVNKDYDVPAYIDDSTLAILVSYSGNTEETLANYRSLSRRGVDMVLISSGGKLLAKKAVAKVVVPAGLPPRGALGHLFSPLPIAMYWAGLMKEDPRRGLLDLAAFLTSRRGAIERTAQRVARLLADRLIVIYANSPRFAVVANRWRCQLNENSKVLAHINVIPEMNHNEIVGVGRPERCSADVTVVFLNDRAAHPRNKLRQRLLRSMLSHELPRTIEFNGEGKSDLQRVFWTVMLGDFLSNYLALAKGIDPMPVTRITELKKKLARYK